ncbi:MAG: alginate lyase family protein [Clostridia bacterium]|nr:alginate lyase family protein [Clostridia bacterium]
MHMLTTYEKLFCEALDTSIPALADIDVTFREKGLEAAEGQLADYIRATLRVNDYFTIPYHDRENVWCDPADSELAAAEKILSGELRSCGFPHKFPDTASVDWECNPTPNLYAEWTWQLSRHHEWRCLGYCYRHTGDEKYTKAFVDLMMSWCEQATCPADAPFYATKCWRTIEAGIRMTLSWHYAFYAFIHSPLMTDHVITTFIRSICDHGYRLRHFGSGGGNWRAMEMAGLAHIAMLYPFLREAPEWGKRAFSVLEAELDNQIYADGFQFELSTNYHDVVIVNYHRVFATARAMGYPVPEGLAKKLLRLFELDIHVTCPDGRYPDLNDGSRSSLAYWCGIGLNYFPDHPAIRWFATEGREGQPPAYTSVALPYSGLAFMRTGWEWDDLWCFMDAGDFGRGHQHEDKLNILLSAYGKNLLPDAGNYAYDDSPMRRFVLDTRSHNCALVDDLGQNRRGRYSWRNEPLDGYAGMTWSFSPTVDTVEGTYDQGYGPEFLPVTHGRKLILFKEGLGGSQPFAVVVDRFTATDGETHTFTPSYQLGFEPYTDDGNAFTADHGDGVTFTLVASVPHTVAVGQTQPIFIGWRKRYDNAAAVNEAIPAPCVRYPLTGTAARLVTVLCPRKEGGKSVASVTASGDPSDTTLTLTFTDGTVMILRETDYPCYEDGVDKLCI